MAALAAAGKAAAVIAGPVVGLSAKEDRPFVRFRLLMRNQEKSVRRSAISWDRLKLMHMMPT